MFLEAHVFSRDKRIDYVWRHLVEVGIDAVAGAYEIAPDLFAVSRVKHRGKAVSRIFELFNWRHITDHSVVDKEEEEKDSDNAECEDSPKRGYQSAVAFSFLALAGF